MNDINDVRKRLLADIARNDSPIEYSAHDRDVLALLDAYSALLRSIYSLIPPNPHD